MLDDPGLRNATFVPLEVSRRPLDFADSRQRTRESGRFLFHFFTFGGRKEGKAALLATVPPPSESLEAALPQLGDC